MNENLIRTERVNQDTPSSRIPAGPEGNFLFGSLMDLTRDRLRFAMDIGMSYGPVSTFRMGPLPIYMVNHPEGVKRVLQDNNTNYSKASPVFNILKGLLGNGLFLSEGEFWLRQRRLMQPMFHRQRVAAFSQIMTGSAKETLDRWRPAAAKGLPLDISQELMRLTLDVACRSLFNVDISQEASHIGEAITFLLEDFVYRFDHPFYPPLKVPTLRNRRYHATIAGLDRIVYRMIDHRRKAPEPVHDILSLLLDVRDEDTGEGMTDKQIRDELMTLLIAGHETTAIALTWALYLLSIHPEVEQRVFQEVSSVCAGRPPEMADLQKLEYTRRVIDETMRLYPLVYITNRVALKDDVVCGYQIPKGATISLSPYVTQHLPEIWENPEAFDPDRFTPERSEGRPSYAYFPFGGGPRLCIGKSFALAEAPLVLSTIVQQCRLYLLPGQTVRAKPLGTLRPDGGLPMTVHFRQRSA